MIRALALAGTAAFVGAILLLWDDPGGDAIPGILLLLASLAISAFLAVRRIVLLARRVIRDAHAFLRGDVQRARLVAIEDPRGVFNPACAAVLELEGEDGAVHRFEHDVPVPFFTAWSYRAAKRLPFLREVDQSKLRELAAFELKREGMSVSLSRP
jgi:hypothetical protein